MLKVTCEHKKEKSSDLMLIIVCATMFARPVKRRWCTYKNAFSTAVIVRLMCAYMRCNNRNLLNAVTFFPSWLLALCCGQYFTWIFRVWVILNDLRGFTHLYLLHQGSNPDHACRSTPAHYLLTCLLSAPLCQRKSEKWQEFKKICYSWAIFCRNIQKIYFFFLRKIVKMKCKTLECGDYKWINSINTRHPNGLI